jgi:hypothetical protein
MGDGGGGVLLKVEMVPLGAELTGTLGPGAPSVVVGGDKSVDVELEPPCGIQPDPAVDGPDAIGPDVTAGRGPLSVVPGGSVVVIGPGDG